MKLKELKKGDFFTLKPIEYPTENQVFIKGDYDRSTKKYICLKWNDACGSGRLLKGEKDIYTEFIF